MNISFQKRVDSPDLLNPQQQVVKDYNDGIKAANILNNWWTFLFYLLRIIITIGPILILYYVGEMDQETWKKNAEAANVIGVLIAVAAALDGFMNPQRQSRRAKALRNWLYQYDERLRLAISKGKTGQVNADTETWFQDRYQELWRDFNGLDQKGIIEPPGPAT